MESVEVADLQGVTHRIETSNLWVAWSSKTHIWLTRLWRFQLHLDVIHSLIFEESDALARGLVVDVSGIVLECHSVAVCNQMAKTEDGDLDFHMIEYDTGILSIGLEVDSHRA